MILRQLQDEICLKDVNRITHNVDNTVPDNMTTTIVTLTDTVDHKISRISCSGESYAKWQIFINSDLKETKVSAPHYAVDFTFFNTLLLNANDILDVKVTHYYVGEQISFESSIYSIV